MDAVAGHAAAYITHTELAEKVAALGIKSIWNDATEACFLSIEAIRVGVNDNREQ